MKTELKNKKSLALAKAREAKKQRAVKNEKLTIEEQMEEDLKEIKRLERISKNVFGKSSTLEKFENKLNKIGNVEILPSRAVSGKKNYLRIIFTSGSYPRFEKYTRADVINKGKQVSKALKKLGLSGHITTALNFDGVVRSGQQTKIGKSIKVYDPNPLSPNADDEEYVSNIRKINKFKDIVFYVLIKNSKLKKGGAGFNNDCLWYCINKAIPEYNPWKYPEDLKAFLKIPRNDMISIDQMEKIEKQIGKVGINITGDYTYTSKLGLLKNIHLTLTNNHYQINHNVNKKVCYVSYEERKIIMINKNLNSDCDVWSGYDGEKHIELNYEMYDDIMNYRTNYIMVIRNNFKIPIEEEYDNYIKMAEEFKTKTDGEINLYKTGSILRTAQKLLDDTTKHITPENILFDEAEVIQNTTQGSTIFNEKYEGEGYKGDIKSMFPYIMSLKSTLIPVKRGIFKQMTQEEFNEMKSKLNGNYAYGIYKMEILPSEDDKINRLFRFSETNEYTSVDLRNADYLGLEMKLVINEEWNVLLYPRSCCLTGEEVFGKYINKVFKHKDNGVQGAKLLLNILSGAIGELNKKKVVVDEEDETQEDIDLDEMGLSPLTITHSRDRRYSIYKCVYTERFFKSNFARFKPFLWAHARFMMSKLIKPINDIVVKCITDGIITTEKLEYFNELGKLKYEGYCPNVIIKNNASPIGEFKI